MNETTTEELPILPESKEKETVYYVDEGETIYPKPDPLKGIKGKYGYIQNPDGIRCTKITKGPDQIINGYQGWVSLDTIKLYRADTNTRREGRSPYWNRSAGTEFGVPERAEGRTIVHKTPPESRRTRQR